MCVAETGEQRLADVMESRELRILLPLSHSLQLDPSGDESRNTVITRHRVLDPLGLPRTEFFETVSDTSHCSRQARLGIVDTVTTWHAGSHSQPAIVTCNKPHVGVAARFQQDGIDRRIPARDACIALSDMSERARKTLSADRLAVIGTALTDPMCQFWDDKNEGPLAIAFRERIKTIVAAQEGARGVAIRRPREEHARPAPHGSDPRPRIYGLPIRAEVTNDGRRRTHVLVYEDFGQIVPAVVEIVETVFEGYDYTAMRVGERTRFLLNADGSLDAYMMTSWTLDDPVLYRQVIGGTLPVTCRPESFETQGPCDLDGKAFWDAEHARFNAPLDMTELAAALSQISVAD